jgi:hypothetical protein
MSKQMLIESLRLNFQSLQDLPGEEMNNVIDQLNEILLSTTNPEIVEKLKSVIADIRSADEVLILSARFAHDFLDFNYKNDTAKVQRKTSWNDQTYEIMYKNVWTDLKKIKDSCCILVGTPKQKSNMFDQYCEDYLSYFKEYLKTERHEARYFNFDEETPDRFKDSITQYIETFSEDNVPYNNHCHEKILSLVKA